MVGSGAVVADEFRMLAAIMRLQPPQVILFWFLGCSRRVRADAGTPATVSMMLRGEGNASGRGSSGSTTSLIKTGERPGAWSERSVAAVAGLGRLNGNWWPGPTVG